MSARFTVTLGGVSMIKSVPKAVILDIEYHPAQIEDTTMQKGAGSGVIHTKRRFSGASVIIYYDLSLYDVKARQTAVLKIQQWAMKGGILRTSDREGQRLNVRCSSAPTVGSALRWTDALSVTFVADENPFWEQDTESSITYTSSGTFTVGGVVDYAPVSATITSKKTITNVTITCGSTSIALKNISVPTGTAIVIDYDKYGFLRIKAGNTDLMANRTGSDELLLPCGVKSTVKVSSAVAVSCTLKARGRWL